MTQTITIRDLPDALARKLKARAARNRRSLQGELIVILENAGSGGVVSEPKRKPSEVRQPVTVDKKFLTIDELWERGKKLGLASPNESTDTIRKLRDERHGH